MLSSSTETISTFFLNEIDVALYDRFCTGNIWCCSAFCAVASVSLLLKIIVASYLV